MWNNSGQLWIQKFPAWKEREHGRWSFVVLFLQDPRPSQERGYSASRDFPVENFLSSSLDGAVEEIFKPMMA